MKCRGFLMGASGELLSSKLIRIQPRPHQCTKTWAIPVATAVRPSSRYLTSVTPPWDQGSRQTAYFCPDTAVGCLCAQSLMFSRLEPSAEPPQRVPYRRQGSHPAFNSRDTLVSVVSYPGILAAKPASYSVESRLRDTLVMIKSITLAPPSCWTLIRPKRAASSRPLILA